MNGIKQFDEIEIVLRDQNDRCHSIYIDVYDNSLSRKWHAALIHLLRERYHLEKNYFSMGFVSTQRDGDFILDKINQAIAVINSADLGYHIQDHFTMNNTISDDVTPDHPCGRNLIAHRMNWLHRYFEDLQGTSEKLSDFYKKADPEVRWHIRQLNLLCHEFESWALSYRKQIEAPEWQRPSWLFCWLAAPRFALDNQDHELFGVGTINRSQGGVYVGVNKAVGKHHWEVFNDEARDVSELVTSTLKSQTEAAGDFDIEWGVDPSNRPWQLRKLEEFRCWLLKNGFDPSDPSLTIGHPKVGQTNLPKSFDSEDYNHIWSVLNNYTDVYQIRTGNICAEFDYRWSDPDFQQRQIDILTRTQHV